MIDESKEADDMLAEVMAALPEVAARIEAKDQGRSEHVAGIARQNLTLLMAMSGVDTVDNVKAFRASPEQAFVVFNERAQQSGSSKLLLEWFVELVENVDPTTFDLFADAGRWRPIDGERFEAAYRVEFRLMNGPSSPDGSKPRPRRFA